MPSLKTHRAQVKKAARNKVVRSFARSRLYRARDVVADAGSPEEAAVAVREAVSALDRAARKGVIHPNQAARKKSRLQRNLNRLQAS